MHLPRDRELRNHRCRAGAQLIEQLAATLAFVDWLTTLVVELEVDHGAGGGAGKARVVLMGHSYVLSARGRTAISAGHRRADQVGWADC